MTKEEATKKAHQMSAYLESEKADEQTHDFDDLWQSLYDICQLATGLKKHNHSQNYIRQQKFIFHRRDWK